MIEVVLNDRLGRRQDQDPEVVQHLQGSHHPQGLRDPRRHGSRALLQLKSVSAAVKLHALLLLARCDLSLHILYPTHQSADETATGMTRPSWTPYPGLAVRHTRFVLFSFLSCLQVSCKDKFQWDFIGCIILFSCAFGLPLSQAGISASLNGLPTKRSGEGVYVLMSFLSASIMPQNIYLLSVLVQTRTSMTKSSLYNDHLFATICVFSGIYLASYILAMSAVNVSIDDPGMVLHTFQDALSLIEPLFRSPIATLSYLLSFGWL
ncbi:hypothetical protein MLD38_012282 [Melastoma candidum]|uniref:Uncharacterized protein n=1 Tax=Melastoma candidum TaxID=119954 RepID=A0ACB9R6E8_9MYRT|nr:hypothetical protein MLD38_012282 [Melastoma candidum]